MYRPRTRLERLPPELRTEIGRYLQFAVRFEVPAEAVIDDTIGIAGFQIQYGELNILIEHAAVTTPKLSEFVEGRANMLPLLPRETVRLINRPEGLYLDFPTANTHLRLPERVANVLMEKLRLLLAHSQVWTLHGFPNQDFVEY